MRNRFKDALLSQGACNPGALCRSLADIQAHLYSEGMGTVGVCRDAASRLIAYQIAYLFNVGESSTIAEDYAGLIAECEKRSEE